ncbi:MAG: polyhydroxyalkanoate synthesis repressor PhaR [Pseudomonadota bacterium]
MKDESHALNDEKATDGRTARPVTVKKYANRRLYNTATSSYVTLDNLAAMARDGVDFVVLDAKTGEDITRSVLTQIIFEEESRGRDPLLPTSFLRQLIRLYGHALQGYVPSYLEATMQAFERNQESFRTQMERSFGKNPGFAQFDAMARANMEMFRNAMTMFATFGDKAGGDAGAADAAAWAEGQMGGAERAGGADNEAELEQLRRQLFEMQRKVDALAKSAAEE